MQFTFPFRASAARVAASYSASLALVGLVTAIIWLLHWNGQLTNCALAYLITVITAAVLLGVGPGVVASAAAGLIFDLFYTPPIGVLSLDDPADVLTCLLFVGSALSLGQLAARQRQATEMEVLRQSDRLKTVLLHAVSHTLRTPLSSIIASAASLRDGEAVWTQGERVELARIIEHEALRLDRLVGNLLDLSRLESGSLRITCEWHDFAGLVVDALGCLTDGLSRHRVEVEIPDDLPPIRLDRGAIEQVLINLVENAIKFSPPWAEVRVCAELRGATLMVAVADQGNGIAPNVHSHIFEPFYRGSDATTERGGLGLGLAVAKGLVEAHGGRIWAENGPAGGACFRFALPYEPAPGLEPTIWQPGS